MATTGIINATSVAIRLTGSSVKLTHSTNAELQINVDMRDATTKDSAGWDECLPGKKSWSMSGEAFTAFDAAYGFEELFALLTAGTSVSVSFGTTLTGDKYYSGTAYVESISMSAGVEENVTYSLSLKGTGAIIEATYVG